MNLKFSGLSLMLAAIFLTFSPALAQHKCGISAETAAGLMEQMQRNRNEMRDFVRERGAITYVPVRFFLIAKSDGTGRASEKSGLTTLCLLNEHYADQDIQFYLKEFKYVNSNSIYSNPMSFSGSNAISNQMIYNAMNIFVVHEMVEEGVLAYYQGPDGPLGNDWIVTKENEVGGETTLVHEVGHFFTLNHTFYGWEPAEWDPVIHGNPVGQFSPSGMLNELVDGSNCTIAGDGICDTPADYRFPSSNCTYTQNAKDFNGQLLEPDIHNFMNYVFGCSDYHFTDGQKEVISNSLFSTNRNYIRPNYTPNTATVTGAPTIISPQQSELIPTYNAVPLEWTALPGADKYLIELTTSGQPTARYVVNTNSAVLTNLLPNKSYLWKVLGYNEFSTCGSFSGQKIFKTGSDQVSDTAMTAHFASWSIGPNPVKVGTPFYLQVEASKSMSVDVTIHAMTGQVAMAPRTVEFPLGKSNVEIETSGLSAGIYLVKMNTESSATTQRISIVD